MATTNSSRKNTCTV